MHVFQHHPGRTHDAFQSFSGSLFNKLDKSIIASWIMNQLELFSVIFLVDIFFIMTIIIQYIFNNENNLTCVVLLSCHVLSYTIVCTLQLLQWLNNCITRSVLARLCACQSIGIL